MKKRKNFKMIILIIFLGLGGWLIYFMIKKMRKADNDLSDVCPYFSWSELLEILNVSEGGLSNDLNDSHYTDVINLYNSNYASVGTAEEWREHVMEYNVDIENLAHTNKGLTFEAFLNNFEWKNPEWEVRDDDWYLYAKFIARIDYWRDIDIQRRFSRINPNLDFETMSIDGIHDYMFPIESVMFQYIWGSGVTGGKNTINDYLESIGQQPQNTLNEQKILFEKIIDDSLKWDNGEYRENVAQQRRIEVLRMAKSLMIYRRDVFLPSLSNYSIYANGWTKRCNRFIDSFDRILECCKSESSAIYLN